MSKNLLLVIFLFLILGVISGRTWYYERSQNIVSNDDAQIEGEIYPIIPKVSEYVAKVLVTDNQEVKNNDLLITLEGRDYLFKVENSKAALQAARATLLFSKSRVKQFIDEREVANADYQESVSDLRRYKPLAENDEISPQQFDEVVRKKTSNASKVKALKDQIAAAVADVGVAEAKVANAAAELDDAELELSYTHITSPVSGRIMEKRVEPGQWVQTGQSLMDIVPLNKVWVVANFKETQTNRMHSGQGAEIYIDSYPGIVFHGKVDSIAAATGAQFSLFPPENATGNFIKVAQRVPVKILISEEDLRSHPKIIPRVGLSVRVSVFLSPAKS